MGIGRSGPTTRPVLPWMVLVAAAAAAADIAAQAAPRPPAVCRGPTSRDPSWAPDGARLVFTSDRTGSYQLWTLDLATGDLTRLTRTQGDAFYPVFSPDARTVAFTLMAGGTQQVALVAAEGGPVRTLTPPDDSAADPSWLPDGRLVFSSARGGERDLWLTTADGSEARRLFSLPGEEWAPRISPDGDRILFHSDRDGDYDVYVADLDGGGLVQLWGAPGFDGVASWSPDGRQVAFYGRSPPSDASGAALAAAWATAEIRAVRADGTGLRALTSNGHRDQSPTWSPDGATIAFTSCGSGNLEVWRMDPSGSDLRRLTHTPAPPPAPAGGPG